MKHLKFMTNKLAMLSLIAFTFTACTDDDSTSPSGKKASMKVNLTDAPAGYDAVLIDVQEVEIHVDSGWISLANINPGIYNLLDFQNGMDTLIATGEVPAGKITQIRLVLGSNNSIEVDGISHPLETPSAQQSGLKLQVHYTLEPGVTYEFWLDFDASRSIVEKGNGGYSLKPVIRVFTKNATGSIEGYVDPVASMPGVLAFNAAGDSASTMADTISGYFLIGGLNPAAYTVEFDPIAPYLFTDTTGVNVTAGNITFLDTVHIP